MRSGTSSHRFGQHLTAVNLGAQAGADLPSMTALKSITQPYQPAYSDSPTLRCVRRATFSACAEKAPRRVPSCLRSGVLPGERVCLSARRKDTGSKAIDPHRPSGNLSRVANEGATGRKPDRGKGYSSNAGSSALRDSTFSAPSSPTLTKACPPCSRLPNSSSSASGRLMNSWMMRAIGRAPIFGS